MNSTVTRRGVAVVAVALLGSLLTACGAGPDANAPAGPITLQTWGDTKGIESLFDAYQDTFPEAADQTLDVVSAGANDADAVAKFRLQLASGEDIPDIVQLNYTALPEFAEAGVLSDLSDALAPYLDNVTAAAGTLSKYGEQQLAVPFEVKEKLWFYRSDLFEQAGIDPTQVKTQEDFVAAGEALKAAFPNSNIWNIGANPQQYQWGMIVSGNGARYSTQTPECEIVVGSDPGVADAFSALKDLRNSGVVAQFDDFTPEWQAGLADGTIASTLGASWLPSFLQDYAPDLAGKWAVTTWPEIGGATGGSEAAGSIFVIPEGAEHKEAALAFLTNLLMTPEGASAVVGVVPGYIPNVNETLQDPAVRDNAYFGTSLIEAFEASSETYSVFPYDPAASAEITVLSAELANYLASDEEDPGSFLKSAQDQLAAQIGCPYQA